MKVFFIKMFPFVLGMTVANIVFKLVGISEAAWWLVTSPMWALFAMVGLVRVFQYGIYMWACFIFWAMRNDG